MARDRLYRKSRQARLRTRVGLAAAVLAGGGAIGVAAVAVTSHPAAAEAKPAAYTSWSGNEGTMLSAAMSDWSRSKQATYSQLARLTSARGFSQTWHHGKLLAVQRGIVVLATRRFLILQSGNGSLHLWLLSGATKFQNVSSTTAGTTALTASTTATRQAMNFGNMVPATTMMAGSTTTAAAMLTPTTAPNTMPVPSPATFTQNAWQATSSIARGDLAVVLGTRSHWTLHAQLVLFSPLSASNVAASTNNPATTGTTTGSTAGSPAHW